MSNYPPGMTKEDWKHIDGEQHHRQCPLYEDFPKTTNYVNRGVAAMLRTVTDHLASIGGYEGRWVAAADCAAASRRVSEARSWLDLWEQEYGSIDDGDPECICDSLAESRYDTDERV